ncbi:hypothetical protein BH09VER1_BH09VER1_02200 [soil metagenome]
MIRPRFLIFAVLLTGLCGAKAQDRADAASRTTATASRTQQATDMSLSSQAASDMGDIQPVSAKNGGLGAYVIANTSLQYTSNPSVSSSPGRGDLLFTAEGGAGIYPNIVGGLYMDGHVSQSVYQYATFSALDFSRFNAGGGLDYVFDGLGQLTASVRYEYERYLDARQFNEFYVNHALTFGLSKEFTIKDNFAIQVGGQGAISLTAYPSNARRNEFDLWSGFRWKICEPLELQTYYIVSLFNYVDSSRVDVTQNVGGALIFSLTSWAKISATANFGANNSTESFFNYTIVNVGGTLGLNIRF